MKPEFMNNAAIIFGLIFGIKALWNLMKHMSYNSPGNMEKKLDIMLRGRQKQFSVHLPAMISTLCLIYYFS